MNKLSDIKVYVTDDYDKFTRLDGNRSIADGRVKKIIDSINTVGYMPVPVLVNENLEVIDGQGRVEACKRLGLPVYYIMKRDAGIDACIAMNINQTNWSIMDYIKSYADRGNQSYKYLLDLLEKFSPSYKQTPVLYAACGVMGGGGRAEVKCGSIQIDKKQYDKARVALSWLYHVKEAIDRIPGRTEYYYIALLYCFANKDIDNDRLAKKINGATDLYAISNVSQALRAIEEVYNYHNTKKVYIETIWRQERAASLTEYNRQYKERRASA